MKVYRIVSKHSEIPLAEIRADDHGSIEWTVDNTNGKLPSEAGDNLASISKYVEANKHMDFAEDDKSAAQLLRYVLENGDVAEVTTDGASCVLNGKILSQEEKAAFFDAITQGTIKVARKADVMRPIPVPATKPLEYKPVETPKLNPSLLAAYRQEIESAYEATQNDALLGKSELDPTQFDVPSDDVPFAQRMIQVLAKEARKNARR
jgi:hypothetical protein